MERPAASFNGATVMNKTFLGILLAVCVLGMALAMFSERLSREPETARPAQAAAEQNLPNLAASNSPSAVPEPIIRESPPDQAGPADPGPIAIAAEKEERAEAETALSKPSAPIVEQEEERPSPLAPAPVVAEKPAIQPQPLPKPAAPEPETRTPVVKSEEPKAPVEQKPAQQAESRPAPAPKPAGAAKGGKISNFVVFARDKGATIRMGGEGKIRYTSMTLENPNRVVVDLDGAWQFPDKLPIPKNEMVNGIRVGKNGDKTRVVIDLKSKPRQSRVVAGQNGASIDVRVDR